MRFYIDTRGCPKNTVDSEALDQALRGAGHVPVDRAAAADVMIVNTCGFIDVAKQESIDRLLELGQNKRPGQQLIAAGCLSQRYSDEVARDLPEVDTIVGIDAWRTLPALLAGVTEKPMGQQDAPDVSQLGSLLRFPASLPVLNQWPATSRRGHSPSAYIKISEGCNYGCTFCAIPIMKGLYRSKPLERIVEEARQLAASGVKEIILVSQDSTAYGLDRRDDTSLPLLLEALATQAPEIPWVRVMYIHPDRLTTKMIDRIAQVPTFCPYIDIPMQHAHPDVLKRMRRGHLIARTEELIERFRERIPGAAVRTTFMVGFPGESSAEFDFLLDWLQRMRFDRAGVFTYSPEEGTPGAEMEQQVPERTRRRRRQRLMEAQEVISGQLQATLVGKTLDVLIEGTQERAPSTRHHGTVGLVSVGRSHRDAPEVDGTVLVRGRHRIGTMLKVRVRESTTHDLVGEAV
ncbi:MAG: 30S ribosomal protein S12 methylthiotransferase RimO [Chloroflexota bacterium]